MKTYKTWEAMKMLTENPKLEFISGDEYILRLKQGNLLQLISPCSNEECAFHENIIIDDEWTLVQKPLTFMEAIKSSKKLRVEHNQYINKICIEDECELKWYTEQYNSLDNILYGLSRKFNPIKLADIIQNGKWYIEE